MPSSAEKLLAPYLAGPPRERGEQDMYCPTHPDSRRSATVNFENGVWWCGKCGGGSLKDLVKAYEDWAPPPGGSQQTRTGDEDLPSEKVVASWSRRLLRDESLHGMLVGRRGITRDTMKNYEIGWDDDQGVFTIPVRDAEGQLVNVRFYDLNPQRTGRKIWQVRGHSEPRLYPIDIMAGDPQQIIICEGEWDALITIQSGFPAITRTASAGTWMGSWNTLFKDRVVYLCHDCDDTGSKANTKVGRALARIAAEVRVVVLPFPHTEKHGKDLSDFWTEGGTPEQFQRLLADALPWDSDKLHPETLDPYDADVLDSFDSERLGKPLRLTVTIKGKREPGYSVPKEVELTCTRDAGEKCLRCPLFGAEGDDTLDIERGDPIVLEMINSTKPQLTNLIRETYGAVKCDKLDITVTRYQAIETLYARPSVEHTNADGAGAYKNIKITSVGRHDTLPNNTVQVVGALHVDPRTQGNEFLAWDLSPLRTSVDAFDFRQEDIKLLRRFRPRGNQRPLRKLGDIARELSAGVTRIYGRTEMHALMDLVWHSVLAFRFDGELQPRGWLQALVVGDTGTGKSETSQRLAAHYGAGEVVACETASLAGVVGGLQQFGGKSNEWAITWGAIPLNDRRLVVLDEVSGLSTEDISSMSQIRSSGLAELTKIQTERTHARTRLLWLGNPRQGKMRDYTYGIQAIRPLIGAYEDIRRFDLAMSVAAGDVATEVINQTYHAASLTHTAEACQALIRWVWSRTEDQVVWAEGAEQCVYRLAQEMGERYVDDPPLVLPADIRMKIARVAVALAARTFSSTEDYESILVTRQHVKDAVAFMDTLYSMKGFGYRERSHELITDAEHADQNTAQIRDYIRQQPGLSKFLTSNPSFRRPDLEEVLNVHRDMANLIINTLWTARMVRKEGGNIKVEPALHDILRETR